MPNTHTSDSGTSDTDSDDQTENFDRVAGGAAADGSAPPLTGRPTYRQAHSAFKEAHTQFSSTLESMLTWSYQVDLKPFTPADQDECPIYSLCEELTKTVDKVRPLFQKIILQSEDRSQEMTASDHQLAATYLLVMDQSLEILKENGKLYPALFSGFKKQLDQAKSKQQVTQKELEKIKAECANLVIEQRKHNCVLKDLEQAQLKQLALLREESQIELDKAEAIIKRLNTQISQLQNSVPPKNQPSKPTPKNQPTPKTTDPIMEGLKTEIKSLKEKNQRFKQEIEALRKKLEAKTQTDGAPASKQAAQTLAENAKKDAEIAELRVQIAALSAQIATIAQAHEKLQKRFDKQSSDFSAYLAAVSSKDQELEKKDQELEKLRAECSYLHKQIQDWRYQYNFSFTPSPSVVQVCRDPAAPRGTLANPGSLFGVRGGNIGSGNGQAGQSHLAGGGAAASRNHPKR